jgi:hypothetical protein
MLVNLKNVVQRKNLPLWIISEYVLLRVKKVGHQTSVSFEKFNVVQALLPFYLWLFIVIEIWHYSSWQFKNLFYTPIFLFQMPFSFDKGRFWLGLCIK